MFLKSLNIQGFKSFPDKVKLDFESGITAVVGPNGSGKSNISDAVSWVLGEQSAKSLRGGKMEDVIFNGTQKRKAMGFSKASIVIDNSSKILEMDSDEVTIARKYYRSGESEYSINGNSVRLRDVQELLMDTGLGRDGYAVIGQGKISEIVSARSQDRRQIFEEAAGISKYRYRKSKSERQLESAQENLIRLSDIMREIEDRLEPLRIQSEKAQKFVLWSNEEKDLEISLYLSNIDGYKKNLREYENKLLITQMDFDRVENDIKVLEEEVKDVYDEMNQCSIEIEKLRKKKTESEKDASDSSAMIAVYKNDIFHKVESIENLESERETTQEEISQVNLSIFGQELKAKELEDEIAALNKIKEENKKSLAVITESSFLKNKKKEELREEILGLTSLISRYKLEEMTEKTAIDNIFEREDSLKHNLKSQKKQIEELEKEISESKNFSNIIDKKLKKEMQTKKEMESKFLTEKVSLENSENNLQNIRIDIENKKNRVKLLQDLENSMEDFSFSVKTIMNNKKNGIIKGIHGPVSKLISVSERYTTAIETALSYGIQNIVVENESTAKKCIELLLKKRAGRATFLPITSVRGGKIQGGYKDLGFLGIASDLVSFESEYQGIINHLLGRSVIVDNIDNAILMAKKHRYSFRIVTLDGQIVNTGGSLTGGSKAKTIGILGRKNEIKSLEIDLGKLKYNEESCAKINTEKAVLVAEINSKLENIIAEISAITDEKTKNNYHFQNLESGRNEKINQVLSIEKEIERFDRQIREIDEKSKDIFLKKEETIIRLKETESQFEIMDDDEFSYKEKSEEYKNKMSKLEIEVLGIEKNLALLEQSILGKVGKKEEDKEKIKAIAERTIIFKNQVNEIEEKIISREQKARDFKITSLEIEKNTLEFLEKRKNLEISTSDTRKKERELTLNREEISKEKIRLEERKRNVEEEYDKIVLNLWEEYLLTENSAKDISIKIEDEAAAVINLKKIKGQIRALGTVNVSAIEEHKEVSLRYKFLTTQIEDIIESKSQLKDLIAALTKTMEDMFLENFEKINTEFSKIFIELFGGGKATLSLNDPDELLESGIEIDVQPPGKVIKNISSLSGGEKSFVAIAIYFAILKVRPAPFCLLDEIEAALDDVNVIKFASYLRTLTDNTQFIAISHRRGTMEEADALYGVTMQEEGVSKLLKLELDQVESSLGFKAN